MTGPARAQVRPAGRADIVLGKDEVHIWRAALDRADEDVAASSTLLSAGECERARRFRRGLDRDRFIVGRGVLRQILSCYVGVPAVQLVFGYNAWGKPELACPDAGIQFSVAHSEAMFLCAVSRSSVGVDIERIDLDQDVDALARVICSPEELYVLQSSSRAGKPHLFYRLWTRKEACLKAIGQGLSLDPRRVSALTAGDTDTVIVTSAGGSRTKWSVCDLESFPGFAAAIAMSGECKHSRLLPWPDAPPSHCYSSVTARGTLPI